MGGSALLALLKEAGLRVKIRLYERNAKVALGSFGVGEERGVAGGEKALEEEGGGNLINNVLAIETGGSAGGSRGVAGGVEDGVGVVGRKALVE
jgi:hypothetical protein